MSELWTQPRQAMALDSAHRWQGTPHRNRVAIPGVGVDCIHFVYEVLIDAGLLERKALGTYDVDDGLYVKSDRLTRGIEFCLHTERITPTALEFGDILVFKNGNRSAHVGILLGNDVWHAFYGHGVLNSDLKIWRREIDVALRLTKTGFRGDPAKAKQL